MRSQKIPSRRKTNVARKIEKVERIVVKTRICPASSWSPFISCAIGTVETARGVVKRAIKTEKCPPSKHPSRSALPIPRIGTITHRKRTPIVICFFSAGIAENSKFAPRQRSASGVATLERSLSTL